MNWKSWMSCCLCCLLFMACSNEIVTDEPSASKTIDVWFTLNLPGADGLSATRTAGTYNETSINDIYILTFKHAADGNGAFVNLAQLSNRTNDTDNNKVTCRANVPRDDTYDIVVLANLPEALNPDNITDLTEIIGTSKADFIAWFEDKCTGAKWDMNRPIPLWGEITKELSKADNNGNLTIDMVRSLARIDVKLGGSVADFKIATIWLYNASQNWQIIPESTNWDDADQKVIAPTESANGYSPYLGGYFYNLDTPGTTYEGMIYTPEAPAGSTPFTDGWTSNTCLVIGGYFDSKNTTAITYYRVDFIDVDGNYLPLLRNHHYTVNITQVLHHGQNSPEAALAANPTNSIYTAVDWTSKSVGAKPEGNYQTTVDRRLVYLPNTVYTTGAGANYTLSITTSNHPGGWTATSSASSWLTVATSGTANGTGSISSKGVGKLYLRVTKNTNTTDREATVTLTSGSVEIKVRVVQRCFEGVRITNSSGSTISSLTFSSTAGSAPSQQSFIVKWSGITDLGTTQATTLDSGGVVEAFEWSPGATTTAYGATGVCEQTYTVAPPALPSNWVTIYPVGTAGTGNKSIRKTVYTFGESTAITLTQTY